MIHYRYVPPHHGIPQATHATVRAFGVAELGSVEHALVAYDHEGEVAGWLRYEISRKGWLYAAGTWVAPEHRGTGISHELWGRVMRRYDPDRVVVTTASVEGRSLVSAVVKWFPDTEFDVRVLG